jgi:hypothetical protein
LFESLVDFIVLNNIAANNHQNYEFKELGKTGISDVCEINQIKQF